jgi:hypothetical protein
MDSEIFQGHFVINFCSVQHFQVSNQLSVPFRLDNWESTVLPALLTVKLKLHIWGWESGWHNWYSDCYRLDDQGFDTPQHLIPDTINLCSTHMMRDKFLLFLTYP